VRVHVTPHKVFGRAGNDLTVTVPVTYPELTLGTNLSVPTLEGSVSVKVPPGTSNGRTMRVRGKGIVKRDGVTGDLLVTLQVAVPSHLSAEAKQALETYAAATAEHDPRAALNESLGRKG
jgi:molecular chaperone DnaJ